MERGYLPVNRTKNYGDNPCFFLLVAFKCSSHFNTITIVGGHKIWTDQQENNLSGIQMLLDLQFPFGSRTDISIIPDVNKTLSLQWYQMPFELIEKCFVFMGITAEDFDWHEHLPACHVHLF